MENTKLPTLINAFNNPSVLGGTPYQVNSAGRKQLIERYNKYIAKNKSIPLKIYFTEDGSKVKEVFYHFLVKSESNDEIIYDVVINLYATDHSMGTSSDESFKNMLVRIFSNSPGFTFTYAYVYNRYKLIPEVLEYKFSKQVLKTPPLKTNPRDRIGFDSTVFFAMYYLINHPELLMRRNISTVAKPISDFDETKIPTPEEVMERRSSNDILDIKRAERSIRSFINKPKDILFGSDKTRKAKKASGALSARKSQTATKAKKAIKSRKPKKPR